jgi:hypothetical protein
LIDRQINYVDDMFAQRLKNIVLETREDTDILRRLAQILFAVYEFSDWDGDSYDRLFYRDYMKLDAPFSGLPRFPGPKDIEHFSKFSREKLEVPKPKLKDLVRKIDDKPEVAKIGVKSTKIKAAKLSKPKKKVRAVKWPCDDCDCFHEVSSTTNPEKKVTKVKKPTKPVKERDATKEQVKTKVPEVSTASTKEKKLGFKQPKAKANEATSDMRNRGKRISPRDDHEQMHDEIQVIPPNPGKYKKLKRNNWHGMQLISGTADKEDVISYEVTPQAWHKRYLSQRDDYRWTSEGDNRNFESNWRQRLPLRKLKDGEDPWKRSNYYDQLIPDVVPELKPKKPIKERLGPKTVSEGFTKAERRLFNPAPGVVKGNFTRRLG